MNARYDLNRISLYSGLKVDKDGSRDIVIIIRLIEENILAILNLVVDSIFLKDARRADPMLLAELFPKLAADCNRVSDTLVAALSDLDGDYFAGHDLILK